MTAYRHDSRQDYAEAYGYDSPGAYEKAQARHDDSGTGHHPSLCSDQCPCKAQRQAGATSGAAVRAA